MNIFVLHLDPVKAAQMHCDKHVVRCITEQTQLLSFVHRIYDQEHADRCGMFAQNSAHLRHPSTLWLAKNTRNYAWGYALLEALLAEYEYRYGFNPQKYVRTRALMKALSKPPKAMPKVKPGTPKAFAVVMSRYPECIVDDPVECYHNYYRQVKAHFAKWTRRRAPKWFTPKQGKRHG